jgi:hypothetical protein
VARKPGPTQPTRWTIYKLAAKQIWIGEVEAADEREAIEKAAEQFKQPATKLHAVRR